jgi:hypothetical protein
MESGELTQDEYASVVQDLTELSSQASSTTVSVLHVLEGRGAKNLERIMAYLARHCGTPVIALDNFEVNLDAAVLLPEDFVVSRGAIIFDLLGADALAAVLNPFDQALRRDVETVAKRKCHFYVTLASQFDKHVERMREAREDREKPPAAE